MSTRAMRSQNSYKRRVTMPPVKMPHDVEEVDQLLRDIMARLVTPTPANELLGYSHLLNVLMLLVIR